MDSIIHVYISFEFLHFIWIKRKVVTFYISLIRTLKQRNNKISLFYNKILKAESDFILLSLINGKFCKYFFINFYILDENKADYGHNRQRWNY